MCRAPAPRSVPRSPARGGLVSPRGTEESEAPRPRQGPPAESRGGDRSRPTVPGSRAPTAGGGGCVRGPRTDAREEGSEPVRPPGRQVGDGSAPFLTERQEAKAGGSPGPPHGPRLGPAMAGGGANPRPAPRAGRRLPGRGWAVVSRVGPRSTGPRGTETRSRRVPCPPGPHPRVAHPPGRPSGPACPSWTQPHPGCLLP